MPAVLVTGPYTELAVSSPAIAVTVASTHCVHPRRDGQAELTWVVDRDGANAARTVSAAELR